MEAAVSTCPSSSTDLARWAAARSGSHEAVRRALQMLRPDDRFALVAYDDVADVVVASTAASTEAKRNALPAKPATTRSLPPSSSA